MVSYRGKLSALSGFTDAKATAPSTSRVLKLAVNRGECSCVSESYGKNAREKQEEEKCIILECFSFLAIFVAICYLVKIAL